MRRRPLCHAVVSGALVAFAASCLGGCGGPGGKKRDLLLLTIDTLRADRLGCYGAPDARTPVLDAWARAGVLVRDCIADVPLTLPSHATILTGRPSLAHGLRVNGAARLADEATTFAEVLTERGYATGAVVSTVVLERRYGLAQGFAHYDDSLASPYVPQDESRFPAVRHWLPAKDRRADEAVDRAIAWLEGRAGAREPVFLWLHLYDPHFPYDPPRPWERVTPHLYDAEVAAVDRELARLARLVERAQARRPFAFLVTSDHGEGLGDHGEDEHGIFVYDETVRVPLLVNDGSPRTDAGSALLDAQVRTVDLAATMNEWAGGAATFGEGGSLLAAFDGRGPVPDTLAVSESLQSRIAYSGSGVKSARTAGRKVIESARPEAFDLEADPGERAPVDAASSGDLREALRSFVAAQVAEPPHTAALDLDAAAEAALRSLGYAASSGAAPPPRTLEEEMRFDGFDPKDLVLVALAGRDLENGFIEKAEAKLGHYFATADPASVRPETAPLWSLAHQNAAKASMTRGDFAAAAAEYERALGAEPSNPDAASGIVFAWNLAGRFAEADLRGRALMAARPADDKLALHVAIGAALAGRSKEAIAQLETLAARARDAETGHVARLYAEKLAAGEGERYLRMYLESR